MSTQLLATLLEAIDNTADFRNGTRTAKLVYTDTYSGLILAGEIDIPGGPSSYTSINLNQVVPLAALHAAETPEGGPTYRVRKRHAFPVAGNADMGAHAVFKHLAGFHVSGTVTDAATWHELNTVGSGGGTWPEFEKPYQYPDPYEEDEYWFLHSVFFHALGSAMAPGHAPHLPANSQIPTTATYKLDEINCCGDRW